MAKTAIRSDFIDSCNIILLYLVIRSQNLRIYFQNLINPLLVKIEFLTSLYRILFELVTEWKLDPDNSRKYIFFSFFFLP